MIVSNTNGHLIEFVDDQWIYADTKGFIDINRPCKFCGESPTSKRSESGRSSNVKNTLKGLHCNLNAVRRVIT